MNNPGTIEANGSLTFLVSSDLGKRRLVNGWVPTARDESSHAADGERSSVVTSADQQLGICPHKWCGHRYRVPVRQDERRPGVPEVLDHAEQVVPTAQR
jgi:hypothetical protein